MADGRQPIDEFYFNLLPIEKQSILMQNIVNIEKKEEDIYINHNNTTYNDFAHDWKHMKVDNLLKIWNFAKTFSKENFYFFIKSNYMQHIGCHCNWSLVSEKFDMTDLLFIKYFNKMLDLGIAISSNPTYNKLLSNLKYNVLIHS